VGARGDTHPDLDEIDRLGQKVGLALHGLAHYQPRPAWLAFVVRLGIVAQAKVPFLII
jgi:hypothetical protein